MEIRFVSIEAFRTALDNLLKVKKGVYASVPSEIWHRYSMCQKSGLTFLGSW